MSDLPYTPMRHKVLAAISKGRVTIDDADRVRAAVALRTTQAQVTRAFNRIEDEHLIEKTLLSDRRFKIELTVAGLGILSHWDAKYGEVLP